jgi:transposase
MITFDSNLTVMIALKPVDFRCGHNKLKLIAEQIFGEDPRKSGLFLYRNRRSTDVKLIFYNGTGFFTGHQKLSKGRLKWWPRTEQEAQNISAEQVSRLILGFDPRGSWHPEWSRIDDESRLHQDLGSTNQGHQGPSV